jgi:hypothetical protein
MKNGWLIFPRWAAGNPGTRNNLWRRAPDGSISQLTTSFGLILAMRDDGGVLLLGGDNQIQSAIYYVSPTGERKAISGDYPLARYFAHGETFYAVSPAPAYLLSGPRLYRIEVEQDPFGITYSWYDNESQKFICYLLPGAPGAYTLERSTDFVNWTPVATATLPNAMPVEIKASTAPGYFRVHKQ